MNIKYTLLAALLALLLTTLGCSRHVSRGLSPQGEVSELVFPDEGRITVKGGTTPAIESLRPLAAGMTKDQLRALIGSPHFREGFGAREWDYLFNLPDGTGNTMRCRFKVVFDQQALASNLYWAPAACGKLVSGPASAGATAPVAPPVAAVPSAPARQFALSADTLFGLGRWSEQDLSRTGRQRLQQIAAELLKEAHGIQDVQVVGHADRIGDAGANLRLSQRRADTVRAILIAAGLPAAGVTARGVGEAGSITECRDTLSRADLVACLAPDRRVEIIARPAG